MADQDFNIKVVTTADTSGIRQTATELDLLKQKAAAPDAATLAARRASLQGAFPQGLPEEALEEPIKRAVVAETELAAGGLLATANLGKARQEALVLARELATGGNVARTLGSLLGALGPALTVAGIGGLVVYEQIKRMREEAQKMVAETQKIGAEFEKSAVSAQKLVQNARSGDDIAKVAESVLPELEKIHARANELNQQTISFWQKQMEDMREGIIQMSPTVTDAMKQWAHPFTLELQEAQRQANELAQSADSEAKRRIERAQDFKRQQEGAKEKPVEESVDALTKKIKEQTDLQNNLNKSGDDYAKSWLSAQAIIDQAKKDLVEIVKYHEKMRGELEKAAPQVKAIVANDQASAQARAEGRERDADLYKQSAEAFRRHATPDQIAEANRLQANKQPISTNVGKDVSDALKGPLDGMNIKLQQILDQFR